MELRRYWKSAEIAELQQKMKEIQDQIPDKGTNDSVSTLKSELREKLNSQLQDIKDFAAKRSKILDQLAALQSALRRSELEMEIQQVRPSFREAHVGVPASQAADATRAKLTKVTDTLNESRGSISELLEKKKANKILVDAAFEKYVTPDREREARIVAMAERELEDAHSAFAEEINLCNALIQFLGSQAGSFDAKTLTATTPLSSRPATASIRTNGKNNKSVAAASTTSATTPNDSTKARPVKMDILTVNQLIALHIAIPVSTDDIPAAVALLTEKKEAFLSEQAAQTAANKQAAQARITQLRETAKTEDTEL
ncbi:hypothetical protein BSLG_006465 [Batrachochytrium salamandrivorans]|nr:hypothetical protein BSLG_006465 [Batrachochytrium salamandrivorans]